MFNVLREYVLKRFLGHKPIHKCFSTAVSEHGDGSSCNVNAEVDSTEEVLLYPKLQAPTEIRVPLSIFILSLTLCLFCLCWSLAMTLLCWTSAASNVTLLSWPPKNLTNVTCTATNNVIWEQSCHEYQTRCMAPKVKYFELMCYTVCSSRIQLKKRYRGKRFVAATKDDCFDQCALSESSEVAEFTIDRQCICGTSNLRAQYFAFVPRRYLACNSSALGTTMMYREDRLRPNLTAIGQAYLFFALDEISGVDNVASRDMSSTDAVWTGVDRGRFDCPPINEDGPRALTLFHVDNHNLATRNNVDFSNAQGFTMMAWAKRRAPLSSGYSEMILSTDGSNTCSLSSNPSYPNVFYYSSPASQGTTPNNTLVIGSWNHIAMVVSPNYTVQIAVDGIVVNLSTSAAYTQTYRQLFIGSSSSGSYYSWDGCLAHVVVFQRDLSVDEIKVVSTIFLDQEF